MDVALKTQLLPNNKRRTYFAKASGISRFTWNWALEEWIGNTPCTKRETGIDHRAWRSSASSMP